MIGGKARAAPLIWPRLGNPRNYVEPFVYGGANLLNRPAGAGSIETVNDLNAYVPNFWRAVAADPEAVAAAADWPVSEADMHARHRWLVASDAARYALQRVREDPDWFDARMAGWWAWGACCWIGTGWCDSIDSDRVPTLEMCAGGGKGVNGAGTFAHEKRPRVPSSVGGYLPGVLRHVDDTHRPQLADAFARGRGVNANDSADTCQRRREWLTAWMLRLADRYRPVRVCCGHWKRVCDSESTTTRLGTTGVMLDPPYRTHVNGKKNRTRRIYANDATQDVNALCDEVQAWCLEYGPNPLMRIALCGLAGEYPLIEAAGWESVAWTSSG